MLRSLHALLACNLFSREVDVTGNTYLLTGFWAIVNTEVASVGIEVAPLMPKIYIALVLLSQFDAKLLQRNDAMPVEIFSIVLAIAYFSVLAYVSWLKYHEHLHAHRDGNDTRTHHIVSARHFLRRSRPKKRRPRESATQHR
jgi:hypothetical protein